MKSLREKDGQKKKLEFRAESCYTIFIACDLKMNRGHSGILGVKEWLQHNVLVK